MIESIRFKWADLTDRVAEGSNEHEILFGKMRERRRSGGTVNARSLMLLSRTRGRGNYEEEADLNRYQMIVRGWGGGTSLCGDSHKILLDWRKEGFQIERWTVPLQRA